jgi:hypothetical protein
MMIIAADPKHLGARIGITAVLHTWGSAMTHHPHVHMIVPGGGIAPSGDRWISSRPAFLLPVRVLGSLFRRLFLTRLMALHQSGKLGFFGHLAQLADKRAFLRHLAPVRKKRWVVYAKALLSACKAVEGPPFGGPEAVLAYLSRYTHRIAISNRRLIAFDERGVTFRFKDYRRDGPDRQQVMTLATGEFIRRFLAHVLPKGFHRIRHYGLLASSVHKTSIALARHAHVAVDIWSCSRRSSAGSNPVRCQLLQSRTGSMCHDPACSACNPAREDRIAGDSRPCAWSRSSGRNHCRTLADAIVIGSNPPQYGTRNSANAAIP